MQDEKLRKTDGTIILREARAVLWVTLWVNLEKPANGEKIDGYNLQRTGFSFQRS